MQTVSLSLFRFESLANRFWAFGQMGLARGRLRRLEDVQFVKQFGSGSRQGFYPYPNFAVYGILTVWPDLAIAKARLAEAPIFKTYRERASEWLDVHLSAISARGLWDSRAPFLIAETGQDDDQPVAVLTRATIKPRFLMRFWSRAPDIGDMTDHEPALRLKIGLGEIPLLHQVTFSIWDNTQAMTHFAYQSGFHAEAVRAKRQEGWFSEELFARFHIQETRGRWQGVTVLPAHQAS